MNIEHFAEQKKFSLTNDERDFISHHTTNLFSAFAALEKINTDNITPMFTVLPVKNILREDIESKFESRDVLLSNAPEQYSGYFQAPKAID